MGVPSSGGSRLYAEMGKQFETIIMMRTLRRPVVDVTGGNVWFCFLCLICLTPFDFHKKVDLHGFTLIITSLSLCHYSQDTILYGGKVLRGKVLYSAVCVWFPLLEKWNLSLSFEHMYM